MPPTNPDFQRQLDRLTDLPSGDADDWKERYAPIIDQVVDHGRPDDPIVSVIVVGWQSGKQIVKTLRAFANQEGLEEKEIEVVFVDNGGLDPVRGDMAGLVDLEIRMAGNARQCRARNTGAAWSRAPYLAFIDDDGVARRDFLDCALHYFDDPTVAGIRGRITHRERPFLTAFALHYDRGRQPLDDYLITEGCAVIRRDPYIRAGGYAESVVGHEGIDLTFRILQLDEEWRTLYAPDVVLAHDYFDSWRHLLDKTLRYSNIEANVIEERPELEDFLWEYLDRDFPVPRETFVQKLAYLLLQGGRAVIEGMESVVTGTDTQTRKSQ